MAVTLRDLLTNPPGKYSRQVGARYMLRDALTAKFRESLTDPNKRRKYSVSVSKKDDVFTVWVKVPSEKYDVVYDVVLRLQFDEGVRAVAGANVQLYCNSPGWVMPVGYVAATTGLLIPGWEHALGRAATEAPTTLNPNLEYGFDKTTYRAFLFATGPGGLVTQADLQRASGGTPPNPRDPKLSAEAKLFEYNRAKDKYAAAARVVKRAERAAKEEDAKRKRAESRNARGTAKTAKVAATAKRVRQAGNAARKKVSR